MARPLRWTRFGQVLYGTGSDEADATGAGPAGINLVGAIVTVQYGYAGNDTLSGIETPTNKLYGGSGNDILDINFGSGSVYGGDGNDSIAGFFANDCLWGGTGRDTINGDYGDDCILGESFVDVLRGDDGNDKIEGGEDRDFIWGGFGSDILHGGPDADVLDGDAQNDQLFGGEGGDELYGDAGDDVLLASRLPSPPIAPWFATQEFAADTLYGGQGSDIIYGGGGGMTAYGDGENDAFFSFRADTLYGGEGNDQFTIGRSGVQYQDNPGVLRALGHLGVDRFTFNDSGVVDCQLYGGAGNDQFQINRVGNSLSVGTFQGGQGADRFNINTPVVHEFRYQFATDSPRSARDEFYVQSGLGNFVGIKIQLWDTAFNSTNFERRATWDPLRNDLVFKDALNQQLVINVPVNLRIYTELFV